MRAAQATLLRHVVLVDLPFVPSGRLLDVGCGAGNLISVAEEAGYECYGVEPSEQARDHLAQCGRLAYVDLDSVDLPRDYLDLVVFNQSLEHIAEPLRALESAVALLRPWGTLIVSAPNFASIESRCYGRYWRHLDVPRHLLGLTPATMRWLATRLQLRIQHVRYRTLGNPRPSYRTMLREAGEDAARKATSRYLLLQLAHLALGQREKCGSMMAFYFRKPTATGKTHLVGEEAEESSSKLQPD